MNDVATDTLRILHVIPSTGLDRGGPSRSVLELCRAQARMGATVALFTGGEPEQPGGNTEKGMELLFAKHLPLPFEIPNHRSLYKLRTEIAKAEIVHLHSLWNGTITLAAILCRRAQKPFVLSPRGMLDRTNVAHRRRLKALYYRLLEHRNLAAVAGWHFLDKNEQSGCQWFSSPQMNNKPVLIMPNGLEVDKISSRAEAVKTCVLDKHTNTVKLLFLGRLHPIKGLNMQVEILSRLRRNGIDACLYLVGPDDGAAGEIIQIARRLGVIDHLYITGPIYTDERYALLKKSDAVLLTSYYECNSMTAAETAAVGGVLVGTETCHLDVLNEAGAAVVVRRSAAEMEKAIGTLLKTPGKAKKLRNVAQNYAKRNLSLARLGSSTLEFYRKILEEKPCAA